MRPVVPLLLLSLVAAPALAVETVGPQQPPKPLTRADAKARVGQMFAESDPNKDGVVTRAEYDARLTRMLAERPVGSPGGPTAAQVKSIRAAADSSFARTDLNKDGKVTAAEMSAIAASFADTSEPKAIIANGVKINGEKYMTIESTDDSLKAKKVYIHTAISSFSFATLRILTCA